MKPFHLKYIQLHIKVFSWFYGMIILIGLCIPQMREPKCCFFHTFVPVYWFFFFFSWILGYIYFLWFNSDSIISWCRWVLLWCIIYSFDRSSRSEWGRRNHLQRLIPFYLSLSLSLFKRLLNCLKFTNMHSISTSVPAFEIDEDEDVLTLQDVKDWESLYHSKN